MDGITYHPGMVTRIRKGATGHLYIAEHMKAKNLNDAALAGRMDVAPVTVWRWKTGKRELKGKRIAEVASAIGLESAEDLYRLPGRDSIDAKLKDAPESVYAAVRDLVSSLTKKAS
jgi:transcriptional regulator with XRE-family HTH domain